jgi:hypothetical protein
MKTKSTDSVGDAFRSARSTANRVDDAVRQACSNPGDEADALLCDLKRQRERLRLLIRLLAAEVASQAGGGEALRRRRSGCSAGYAGRTQ